MRFNRLLLVVPFLCFTSLLGCSGDCESMCDKAQDEDCKGAADHDYCIGVCTAADDMKEDTDKCSSEFDDLVSCANDADDICDVFETDSDTYKRKKCNSELEDYVDCLTDYCKDHESRDYCN
jgi:hypothetical protein